MIAGVTLILAGLLLVLYPPLLSIIVAMLLVLAGALVMAIAHYERKLQRHHRNPTVEFFFWH
jgi:drug/metabolite transporter (DMT)-like permease